MTVNEVSENVYDISFDGTLVLTAGFNVISLVTRTHFVWIELHDVPTRKQLIALRRVFEELRGISMFCNVRKSNRRAIRTAEFFGFKKTSEDATVVIMEREV